MKKPPLKKNLPLWVPIVVIAVALAVVVALWARSGSPSRLTFTRPQLQQLQSVVDKGGTLPGGKYKWEQLGIKFPANYKENLGGPGRMLRSRRGGTLQSAPAGMAPSGR